MLCCDEIQLFSLRTLIYLGWRETDDGTAAADQVLAHVLQDGGARPAGGRGGAGGQEGGEELYRD